MIPFVSKQEIFENFEIFKSNFIFLAKNFVNIA